MKKFLILLATALIMLNCSCGTSKKQPQDISFGSMYANEYVYTKAQVDSMCVADTLNSNLFEWMVSSYNDFETNSRITKYVYIKELNDSSEFVYVILQVDDKYHLTKRYGKNK